MIILRSGIVYSIIICTFISFSCFFSAFLISLKPNKIKQDTSLMMFLSVLGFYWFTYMLSNFLGWLNIGIYKHLSFLLNLLLFLQPIPLLIYFIRNNYAILLYTIIGFVLYIASLGQTIELTSISYWGVQHGTAVTIKILFILSLILPLAAETIYNIFLKLKKQGEYLFIESISLIFLLLVTVNVLSSSISWNLLILRMLYILIGFIAYFSLTDEEATAKFIGRIWPWFGSQTEKIRALRIPFFAKLLILFMLLSVLPIAAAGFLLFITFKEIIDLYIYKPLLWNLKTSKEEFLVALGNVQIQALFLIMLAIILVVIVSSIASRAIAQSLKRIGHGMKRLEEGDLNYKITPESNDEIGDLANYFNKMASEIKRSREIMENWNKELERTVEERTKNLQTLYNISKAIGSTLDLEALLAKAISYIPSISDSTDLAIFIKDNKDVFQAKIKRGHFPSVSFRSGEGLLGEAISSEQIVKIADIKDASQSEKSAFSPLNIKTMLLAPMESKGIKLGLIAIGIKKEYTPSNIELNLLSTISDQMAVAIENANVYEKEKEAVKKLIDIDKMKTELISMVSHELRTPLTSIKGFLSHFISGTTGPVNDTQLKFLNIMSKEGDHLLVLIDSLLEFSKVERGVFTIKKEPVQIDKLITGIVEAIRPQLDAKDIKLKLDLNASEACFSGDETKIGQVLRNIMGNSIKFIKERPEITITSAVLPIDQIEVMIRDNGMGIPKEHLEKIFDKFYQVDGSLTRKVGGLGLGLLISKEIIEAHGGRIWAESEGPGKGTALIFTIPMIK